MDELLLWEVVEDETELEDVVVDDSEVAGESQFCTTQDLMY